MGGTKKKGVVGATSPWPGHSYNNQDHNQCTHTAAMLSETVELKQITDQTQGLPPRDLFIWFIMSSVEDLTVKVCDHKGQSGQTEVLQQFHQIQNMLNKQTEEMKTLQQVVSHGYIISHAYRGERVRPECQGRGRVHEYRIQLKSSRGSCYLSSFSSHFAFVFILHSPVQSWAPPVWEPPILEYYIAPSVSTLHPWCSKL